MQADDGFLEALSSFILSIPTADIWQDQAWRQQQAKLLSAQFGPKEVESLAMNTVLPIPGLNEAHVDPLQWVQEKELRELQVSQSIPLCRHLLCRQQSCMRAAEWTNDECMHPRDPLQ